MSPTGPGSAPESVDPGPTGGRGRGRWFAAIDAPAGPVAPVLAALAARGLRTTPPGRLHLTLAFMPAVPPHAVPGLSARLAAIAGVTAPFPLTWTGSLGRFGARVIWAGVRAEGRLDALVDAVRGCVDAEGVPRDDQPFVPHVTLARGPRRVRGGSPPGPVGPGGAAARGAGTRGAGAGGAVAVEDVPGPVGSWLVEELRLVQSVPGPTGTVWHDRHRWRLAGASPTAAGSAGVR